MRMPGRSFRVPLGVVLFGALAACPGSRPVDFEYEPRSAALQITGREAERQLDVTDLTFASPLAGRVPARLIRPSRSREPPAVVFQHQLGENHLQFDPEVRKLAHSCGIASLLVAAPFARPRAWRLEPDWRVRGRDAEIQRRAIIDLRAALDILPRLGLDPGRVAFVGHSYGANWGAILSAVEGRYRAFVLIAGLGSVTEGMDRRSPEWEEAYRVLGALDFERYRRELRPFDPDRYVGRAPTGALFFQFGARDAFVSMESARRFVASASSTQSARVYDTDHDFADERAMSDRKDFLARKLGARCT